MLYVEAIRSNDYIISDTEDGTRCALNKKQVLSLNKNYKILGVSDTGIDKVDIHELIKRWQLLGVLEAKLKKLNNSVMTLQFHDFSITISVVDSNITFKNYTGTDKIFTIPEYVTILEDDCFSYNNYLTFVA